MQFLLLYMNPCWNKLRGNASYFITWHRDELMTGSFLSISSTFLFVLIVAWAVQPCVLLSELEYQVKFPLLLEFPTWNLKCFYKWKDKNKCNHPFLDAIASIEWGYEQERYIEELSRFYQCLNTKTGFVNFWSVQ